MTFTDFAIQIAMYAIALLVYEMASAPLGYEDADGFHAGEPVE